MSSTRENTIAKAHGLRVFETYTRLHFLRDLKEPYAWPGGYPRYFITSDGEAMSYEYAEENEGLICEAIDERDNGGWRVVACDVNYEDADLYCCGNDKRIPSAYAEDDASA